MTVMPKYDAAISFLNRDEHLALQIQARLMHSLNVFVYSKRQEELAGSDPLESFRQAFRSDSRLVVVLYRDGWGQTSWTRVEGTAIQERCLKEGWEFLLFVTLDQQASLPIWLPEHHVRLDFTQYRLEQLLGAIKARAEKLGSKIRVETAVDVAQRVGREIAAHKERERLLSTQGFAAVKREYQALTESLNQKLAAVNTTVSGLTIESGFDDREYICRTNHVSVDVVLHSTHPPSESRIVSREWLGSLILPKDRSSLMYTEHPEVCGTREFYFDYQSAYSWCWRSRGPSPSFLSSTDLAEWIIKLLLNLHARFERGEIKHRTFMLSTAPDGPDGWMAG